MAISQAELVDGALESFLQHHEGPVIVVFTSPWSAPSKYLQPIVRQLREEFEGLVEFLEINVDEFPTSAYRLGVLTVPTLLFYRAGRRVGRTTGVHSEDYLREKVNQLLEIGPQAEKA